MPFYESVFIARQDISAQQVETLADQLAEIITAPGGKITKRENWGLRNLAYRIKKNRKGHYVLFNIEASSDVVKEYERQMRINEDVIRYLTTRVEELDDKPSVILTEGKDTRGPKRKDSRFDGIGYGEEDDDLPSFIVDDEEEE